MRTNGSTAGAAAVRGAPARPEVVIRLMIPGPWGSTGDLARALPQGWRLVRSGEGGDVREGGMVGAGGMLGEGGMVGAGGMHGDARELRGPRHARCAIELRAAGPGFASAFMQALGQAASEGLSEALTGSRAVACLSGPGGTKTAALAVFRVASALVHAGGAGVLVEGAALAHEADRWVTLVARGDPESILHLTARIVIAEKRRQIWSIGMAALGLADAIVTMTGDAAADRNAITAFLLLTCMINEPLAEGASFGDMSRMFDVTAAGPPVRDDRVGENPYGYWKLEPALR